MFLSAPLHVPSSQAMRHSSSPSPHVVTRFVQAAHQQPWPKLCQLCHSNFFFTSYFSWIWNWALDFMTMSGSVTSCLTQAFRHSNYVYAIKVRFNGDLPLWMLSEMQRQLWNHCWWYRWCRWLSYKVGCLWN